MSVQTYGHFIDGKWIGASDGARFENRNPANAASVLSTFPLGTREDAQLAIAAARNAFPDWARTPAPQRAAILDRASDLIDARLDELATVLTSEEGKTLAEARGEVTRARDIFRYYAGEGWRAGGDVLPSNTNDELLYTRREPLGVIGIITPWNFPIAIPAWKIAPALAYGNTVVFKPASLAPQVGAMLVEILNDAGMPAGAINFVTGSGSIVGDEIVANADVNGISFTGSYGVGKAIYEQASERMARVQCEMGGKNPLIVLNDADVEVAVTLAVKGGFGLTGQACTATSRVIVEEQLADAFAERLTEVARTLVVGDGLNAETQMGPAVSQEQLETDLEYVSIGVEEGATLRAGGDLANHGGFYVQPTVFEEVHPDMRIAQEEIFGPVIGIIRAHDFDEALDIANGIPYGLSAGIVTNDMQKAFHFANRINAGVVKINRPTTGVALQAPFGGFKHSSANTFKEQGQAAREFYTRTKTIYVGHG